MNVGEFQKAIGVTGNAYSRFMGQNGTTKGIESSVYGAAWAFFKKRELQGLKMTRKTAASAASAGGNPHSVEGITRTLRRRKRCPFSIHTCARSARLPC